MDLKNLLLDRARPMIDPLLDDLKIKIIRGNRQLSPVDSNDFIDQMTEWILSNSNHVLNGIESFKVRHACFGVTHYIDSLLIEHSNNIQLLEHDYMYYRRLFPNKSWAVVGNLQSSVPLLIALPFPGAGDIHPKMNDILEECLNKNIAVHLDCAWLPISRTIKFDFSHPTIKSFAISLSKSLALDWNRIGVCYRKEDNPSTAISIANSFKMINQVDIAIGIEFMNNFHNGYLWEKYGNNYDYACKTLKIRPTNVLHLAFELGSNRPLGVRDVLLKLHQQN